MVHDEAHLEPAFQTLLEAIKLEQDRNAEEKGKLHVMELTATSRGSGIPFELTSAEQDLPNPLPSYPKNDEDKKNTPPIHHVWWRLAAKKALKFHVEKRDLVPKTIGEMARNQWRDSQKAILIFVRTVGDVRKVVDALTEKKQGVLPEQVQLLTGTLRGLERDRLASDDEIFARFLPSPKVKGREGTVYLVCTSAGEVGVDISADHMICDLSSLDSMTQRFGRVNRRGEGDAQIDVVCESDPDPKKQENAFEQARWFTKEVLEQLPETNGRRNVSPRSLMDLKLKDDERKRAFAPEPTILPSTDILFDSWALTSIESRLPGRPYPSNV